MIGTDLALEWDAAAGAADLAVESNDLKSDNGLRTAIYIALFTNAPAQAGDVLPDDTIARGGEGGWWADAEGVAVVEGDHFGSRLWLLDRSKNTRDVVSRANVYGAEALQWLRDDLVTDSFTFTAELMAAPNPPGLGMLVEVVRPTGTARFRFDRTWTAEAAR